MLYERHGSDGHSAVRVRLIPNPRRKKVIEGSTVYTDGLKSYDDLADAHTHVIIDHAGEDLRSVVHNGMENFWSLVRRAIKGTYVSVEPYHHLRFLDRTSSTLGTKRASACLHPVSVQ